MKCTVEKELLLTHLQRVCNVVSRKAALPILSMIHVKAEKDSLILRTTNLEIELESTLKANVEESGTTTIPAKSLLALVSKLNGTEVSFHSNKKFQSTIQCGNAEFKLVFTFESKRKITLEQKLLSRMIDSVAFAVSIDDSRKTLQGILLSVKDGVLTAVSTDGKRLALVETQIEDNTANGDIIVPLRTALEIRRQLGKEGMVELGIDDKTIRVQIENTVMLSKLIEGIYPNFRQIIPSNFQKEVELPRNAVQQALELVAVPQTEVADGVKLTLHRNKLELYTQNSSIGEGRDVVDINYGYEDEISLVFNTAFLLDPFRYTDKENFRMKIIDPTFPVALEDGTGFLYVVMPLRKK
jgi:DNA polymerase III subunit beta